MDDLRLSDIPMVASVIVWKPKGLEVLLSQRTPALGP